MAGAEHTGTAEVVAIFTAPEKGAPMVTRPAVWAEAGFGLEGDRKAGLTDRPGRQVTLVAQEALDALAEEHGIHLPPEATRRNLVTRGVELHDLVGRRFLVGGVELRGVRPCDPCSYLEEHNGIPGLRRALEGRGGLRAEIVTSGEIRVGDPILVADADD